MKNLILFISFLLIQSCSHRCEEYDEVTRKEYILLDVNPPKHFYVDLKEVETGKIFNNVYVSKHCNNWKNLRIGGHYFLTRGYMKHGGKESFEFINLYQELCQ